MRFAVEVAEFQSLRLRREKVIYPDRIIRSSRKTLSVSVCEDGKLVVRAPLRCSEERIFSFLREKEKWIEEKREKARLRPKVVIPQNLNGFSFPLLGRTATVWLYKGGKVVLEPQTARIYVPETDSRERLVRFLKTTAKEVCLRLATEQAKRMKTSFPSLTVTSARRRWGSCSGNDSLHFSFRLLYAPEEVIEYVVVHELAHTFHKNHGARFWKTVEKYVPDYKEKLRYLSEHSWYMQIF